MSSKPESAMHPVAERFVSTRLMLLDILKAQPKPLSSELLVLKRLLEAHHGRVEVEEALEAARSQKDDGVDPHIWLMILVAWKVVAQSLGLFAEAEALLKRIQILSAADMSPELRALAKSQEAGVAMARGRIAEAEEHLRRCYQDLPGDSVRRPLHLIDYAMFLAHQGRLTEIESEVREMEFSADAEFRYRINILRFIQFSETLQLGRAGALLAQLLEDPRPSQSQRETLLHYGMWIKCLSEETRGRFGTFEFKSLPRASERREELMYSIRTCRELLRGRPFKALEHARQHARMRADSFFVGTAIVSYDIIRSELACGNLTAARRLLRMRMARGAEHYLDGFFLARCDLLEGLREEASRRFAQVQAEAARYHAQNRVDFELLVSCELSAADAVVLAGGGERLSLPAAPLPPSEERTEEAVQGSGRILGQSARIAAIREVVSKVACSDIPVLITGETGTGKELIARAIHESGPRAADPFLAINCVAIAESLLEAEFFGHARGAFTGAIAARKGIFEEAGKGTVLLDEIGDIPPRLQVVLLRVLESGEVRPVGSSCIKRVKCRVLAATNADLAGISEQGRFRKDLFYRLRRLAIELPPLRDRLEDVPMLMRHFLAEGRSDGRVPEISAGLVAAMLEYDWPGNVRELRNVAERMRTFSSESLRYGLEHWLDRPGVNAKEPETDLSSAFHDSGSTADRAPSEVQEVGELSRRISVLRSSTGPARRRRLILELFAELGGLKRKEIVQAVGMSPLTATRDLRVLIDEGLVEKVMPNRSPRTHYFRLKEGR